MSRPVDYALEYARNGFAVMPLRRADKRPHLMLGSEWSFETIGSIDARQITEWWGRDRAANIGVVTGRPSGLLVLDCDVKHDVDGIATLADRDDLCALLTSTWSVDTPGCGRHYWLRLPSNLDRLPTKIGWLRGVDAKADGGQVAAPPSCRRVRIGAEPWAPSDYVEYRPQRVTGVVPRIDDVAVAPPELIADIRERQPTRTWSGGGGRTYDDGGRSLSDLPATEWLVEHGFPPGRRDDWCWALANRLWWKYGDEGTVVGVMHRVFKRTEQVAAGDPVPFTWDVVYRKVCRARDRYRSELAALQRTTNDWKEAAHG